MGMDPEMAQLQAWRAGDRDAADALLLRYHTLIWRAIATKVSEAEVEDLVQKVILAIIERRDEIRSGLKFRSYVMAVTRFTLLSHYRERYRKPVDLDGDVGQSVQELGAGPSTLVLARQQDRLLLEALRSLSIDDQFVLELYYWEGMTGPELSDVFNCLEPTIRGRLRRARERLDAKITEMAKDHSVLAETSTNLDSWAASVRDAIDRQRSSTDA